VTCLLQFYSATIVLAIGEALRVSYFSSAAKQYLLYWSVVYIRTMSVAHLSLFSLCQSTPSCSTGYYMCTAAAAAAYRPKLYLGNCTHSSATVHSSAILNVLSLANFL